MPVPVCGYILSYFCNLGMRFFTTHAADAFFVGAGGAFTTIFFRKAKIILEDVKDSKQCCEKNKQNGVGKFWLVKDFIIFLRDVTLSTKKIFKYVTYCFIGGFFSVLLTYGIENSQRLLIESLTVGIGTELIFFKIFRKDK